MQTQEPNMDGCKECMALIFIMLLSTALAGCPSKCICLENVVKCSGKFLMNIPNFDRLENDPTTIDLSMNEFDSIAHNDLSFDKAGDVQILYLNNSNIIDVDDIAFKELINIEEIYLSQNLLGEIPPNLFQYNSKLVLLDLSINLFRIMPKLISNSLETLLLRNSGIERVEGDSLAHIPNLKYLNLQRNNIKMINTELFKFLPKLRLIQLEFNQWRCTCQSVQLFHFLHENSVLDIKEPIQCRNSDDFFVNFFSDKGTLEPVKDLCMKNDLSYNFVGNYIEPKEKEIFNQRRSAKGHHVTNNEKNKANNQKNKTNQFEQSKNYGSNVITTTEMRKRQNKIQNREFSTVKCEEHYEYIQSFTLSSYIIFFIAVILAFFVGLVSGCLFSGSKSNKIEDYSLSFDSLLRSSSVV